MELTKKLQAKFQILEAHAYRGDETVVVKSSEIVSVMKYLKESEQFNFLMDLTVVDYPGRELRFEVVYHLYSLSTNKRIRVKSSVSESNPVIASVIDLWKSADWMEREAWDLYGVKFEGHPDLRRVLLYEEFVGHPLRKDYPVAKRQPLVGPMN